MVCLILPLLLEPFRLHTQHDHPLLFRNTMYPQNKSYGRIVAPQESPTRNEAEPSRDWRQHFRQRFAGTQGATFSGLSNLHSGLGPLYLPTSTDPVVKINDAIPSAAAGQEESLQGTGQAVPASSLGLLSLTKASEVAF